MNQWAIKTAMDWEINQSPPDKVSLRNAVNIAKQLKKCALDLEAANIEVPEMELEAPY